MSKLRQFREVLCSERMPEKSDKYWVTIKLTKNDIKHSLCYNSNTKIWDDVNSYKYHNVISWLEEVPVSTLIQENKEI